MGGQEFVGLLPKPSQGPSQMMIEISRAIAAFAAPRAEFELRELRMYLMARKFSPSQINQALRHWELSYFDYGERGRVVMTRAGQAKVTELLARSTS
jgi:hypothetical protein